MESSGANQENTTRAARTSTSGRQMGWNGRFPSVPIKAVLTASVTAYEEDLTLIRNMRRRNPNLGLTELWIRLKRRGYSRCVESLYRVMQREGLIKDRPVKEKQKSKPYEQ